MPHIIRDAEFKTSMGDALWPGMWVHTWAWGHKSYGRCPLDVCYLWRVEQHDGVLLLAAQGAEALVPLTPELAEEVNLIEHPACELLLANPAQWAALRKTGWGVHLHYYSGGNFYRRLRLECRRRNSRHCFFLLSEQHYQLDEHPQMLPTFLATCAWRLKHPNFANALAGQQPREFWDWPNVPSVKQLHALGQAAYRTEQGQIEIGPDGELRATGRKAWDWPDIASSDE